MNNLAFFIAYILWNRSNVKYLEGKVLHNDIHWTIWHNYYFKDISKTSKKILMLPLIMAIKRDFGPPTQSLILEKFLFFCMLCLQLSNTTWITPLQRIPVNLTAYQQWDYQRENKVLSYTCYLEVYRSCCSVSKKMN